jgi:hypothetical protein
MEDMVVREDITLFTKYSSDTSSTSPELNPDLKIIQNQSGNVVAVPPEVHGGHGGEGGHHPVHQVQVRYIKYKSRLKFKNDF